MIQYTIWSEEWEKYRKLFTVENKNIEKLERVMKRKMPRARFIKLYIVEWDKYLFPIWRFNKHLEEDVFSQEVFAETFADFNYGWSPTSEQSMVLDDIKEWRRTGLIVMKTWSGKCYWKWTWILMKNWSIKNIEDIVVWDKVMWPDSNERNVVWTTSWNDILYKVSLIKWQSFVCNWSHILVLRASYTYRWYTKWQEIKITVDNYLKQHKSRKHQFKITTSTWVDFNLPQKNLEIDPYALWLWLWDWDKDRFAITTPDIEIIDYLRWYASEIWMWFKVHDYGRGCKRYMITNWRNDNSHNLTWILKDLWVYKNKHIPEKYLLSSREDRFKLLWWLIDSDWSLSGSWDLSYTTISKWFADQVVFLCRSLWFCAVMKSRITKSQTWKECLSYTVRISWDICKIPTKVQRKKAATRLINKRIDNHWFSIEEIWFGEYFWFELDWDHLHLLDNFIISHNSHIVMQIVNHFREPVVILTHNLATLHEMKEKFKEFCWVEIGEFNWKKKDIRAITVSTHSSFMKNRKVLKDKMKFSQIIFDEADSSVSDKMLTALIKFDPSSLFWMTWTPKRTELDGNDLQLIYGKIIKCEGQINNWYKILPDIVRLKYNTKICSYEDHWDMKAQLMWEKERIEKQILFIIEKIVFEDVKYWLLLVERREEESQEYYNLLSPHINCVLINWHTKKEDDIKAIDFIKQNGWIIVWTLKKVWRWVDIPFLDWVFIFFQNHFYSLVVQAVWRWLRSHPWKDKITLYDRIDVPISSKSAATRLLSYRQEYPWCKITDFNI